jgi:transposase
MTTPTRWRRPAAGASAGGVAQRLVAIRDIMLGRSRAWVCAQYCVSRENLRHWVQWYNAHGMAGLEDAPRAGRPCKLTQTQRASLPARVSVPPDIGKAGVGRWRAADVQRLIRREYGVEYRSITGVCHLLHRLGQSWISGRPQHPHQAADAVASFKKTPGPTAGHRRRASRQDHGAVVPG